MQAGPSRSQWIKKGNSTKKTAVQEGPSKNMVSPSVNSSRHQPLQQATPSPSSAQHTQLTTGGVPIPSLNWRPSRKKCNCKASHCLKLYCECFASREFCRGCNCKGCKNNENFSEQRRLAIMYTLERNPNAFRPKIASSPMRTNNIGPSHLVHNKGCQCKKSQCRKKYCECFQAGILCSNRCKCQDCENTMHSRSLDPLGDLRGGHQNRRGRSGMMMRGRVAVASNMPSSSSIAGRKGGGMLNSHGAALRFLPYNGRSGIGNKGGRVAAEMGGLSARSPRGELLRRHHQQHAGGLSSSAELVSSSSDQSGGGVVRHGPIVRKTALMRAIGPRTVEEICERLLLAIQKEESRANEKAAEDLLFLSAFVAGGGKKKRSRAGGSLAANGDERSSKRQKGNDKKEDENNPASTELLENQERAVLTEFGNILEDIASRLKSTTSEEGAFPMHSIHTLLYSNSKSSSSSSSNGGSNVSAANNNNNNNNNNNKANR